MKQILDNFGALGRQRLILLGATGLVIVAALIFGLSAVLSPNYRPIGTGLSASEGAEMVRALEQAGYQPQVSGDGSLVSLPEPDIARARMALAEAGVSTQGMPGWELFDQQSGLGMNTFLQRVNRLRALEGELARSVQTIDVVDTARVHLVLPEREAFSAERPEATAAVIIRTRRGQVLERKQAMAVRGLVSAALPGLSPENVTVLSASGETILSADGESADGSGNVHSARIAMEDRISRNIEQMLSARVGAGNVRVRVAAELATTREVITKESFDPEGSVPRETRSVNENANNSQGSDGNVDVANNIPGGLNAQAGGETRQENRARSEDETRFEIGSTRSETVIEPGGLRRLSVAVLVNGSMVDGAYQDRNSDELERLSSLVRSTMGFDDARGDVLTVDSLQFVDDGSGLGYEVETTMAEKMLAYLPSMLRWVIALMIVAIVVFFAIRPALNRVTRKDAEALAASRAANQATQEVAGEDDEEELDENGNPKPKKAKKNKLNPDGTPAEDQDDEVEEEEDPEEFVALASVKGAVTKRHLEQLSALVDQDSDAALRQIRVWLNEKNT